MKKRVFKIINIIEPIIFIIFVIGLIYTAVTALSIVDWVSLGGKIRELYWYEQIISTVTSIVLIIYLLCELLSLFLVNKKYKLYTIIYILIELIIAYSVWNSNPLLSFLIIFVLDLVRCIFRIKKIEKVLN